MTEEELWTEIERYGGKVLIGFRENREAAGADERGAILVSRGTVEAMTAELGSMGLEIEREFSIVPAVAASLSNREQLRALLQHNRVEYVEPQSPGSALAQDTSWNVFRVKADSAWSLSTGSGARLLVIDTGADTGHTDINYTSITTCVGGNGLAAGGHGLEVAGVAAATANASGVIGVAHDVALYSVMADRELTFYPADVVCALEFAMNNNIDVANMSFRMDAHSTVSAALNSAYYHYDIILVGATGKEGYSYVEYPASQSAVIAVGATTAINALATFSHTGPQVELVAPGVLVETTCGANTICARNGTSYSAPQVAAAAALLRSADSTMSAQEVRRRLAVSALDLGTTGRDHSYGYGLLQVFDALTTSAANPPAVTIIGPTEVQPFVTCSWSASVSGGESPYTYSWDGQSSTSALDYANTHNHGEWFTLYVTVTGNDLASTTASLQVHVSDSAMPCPN